jgi:hypothetical protein
MILMGIELIDPDFLFPGIGLDMRHDIPGITLSEKGIPRLGTPNAMNIIRYM